MSTPVERMLQAKIAAHESWARTSDRAARTAKARNVMLSKFERLVDPDGLLNPDERAYRVEQARKAHYTRMALKSAQSRRRRCEGRRKGGEL
ncbi:hypothetical protein DFR70_103695 [Nocardia tenerifensis]|uniref:Uncharacterized protein n=1 Tax=Nocardia tenerifensis TaxID=228006 RepID=A0A318K653_9NOCA|nr:hypothetical protein [Nocardia tenerifensis]PXX66940.1 hypothetical protein DFR70_103695 [Nocardia tenerifensis]